MFSLPLVAAVQDEPGAKLGLAERVGLAPKRPARALVLYFFTPETGAQHLETFAVLSRRYGKQGLQVVGVLSQVDAPTASAFAKSVPEGLDVVRDSFGVVSERYGFPEVPMIYVLDASGRIASIGVPEVQLEDTLEARIKPLLDVE